MGWLRHHAGTTTVEFAVIAPLFFALVFAIIEFSLGFYWWKSAEKATMIGARMAVVRDPAVVGLPGRNELAGASSVFGLHCWHDSSPCLGFDTLVCSGGGGSCNENAFSAIVGRMQQIFPAIEPEFVVIIYRHDGLGYAGGPTVPAVTVELREMPAPFIALNAVFGVLGGDARGPVTLPPISATLTGEDLRTAGAG